MNSTAEQFRLDGRTALVTGAGRGVGAGIAEVLAAADILVHNAGVVDGGGRPNPFVDMPVEDWQLQISSGAASRGLGR